MKIPYRIKIILKNLNPVNYLDILEAIEFECPGIKDTFKFIKIQKSIMGICEIELDINDDEKEFCDNLAKLILDENEAVCDIQIQLTNLSINPVKKFTYGAMNYEQTKQKEYT